MKKLIIIIVSIFLILVFVLSPLVMAQTPAATAITVEGQLVNGTPGGIVGADIPLMLHTYDGQQAAGMLHGVSGPEGRFRFEDVEVVEGRRFTVMAAVGQTTYFSDFVPVLPGQTILELPVTIYDATTDDSAIRVEQMHLLVEFLGPTQMEVTEIYIISNDGDRTVENAVALDDGQAASLRFTLPQDATGLSFERNNADSRFTHTVDGFADTWGVPPGSSVFQSGVKYLLPYEDGLHFERVLSYPVGQVNVMLSQGRVSLTGENFTAEDPRQLQDGRTVDVFTIEDVPSGQPFAFELDGQPEFEGQSNINSISSTPPTSLNQQAIGQILLIAGLVVLGLVAIGGGVWQWRRQAGDPTTVNPDSMPEIAPGGAEAALIRTIAELDEAYQAGIIPEERYFIQRGDLRTELKELLAGPHQLDSNGPGNMNEPVVERTIETNLENFEDIK